MKKYLRYKQLHFKKIPYTEETLVRSGKPEEKKKMKSCYS